MKARLLVVLPGLSLLLIAASGFYLNQKIPYHQASLTLGLTANSDSSLLAPFRVADREETGTPSRANPVSSRPNSAKLAEQGQSDWLKGDEVSHSTQANPSSEGNQAKGGLEIGSFEPERSAPSSAAAIRGEARSLTIANNSRSTPTTRGSALVLTPLPLPLAFQELEPEVSRLSAVQVRALDSLRSQFVDQIGGPGQNPYDPGYANRWLASLPESDSELRLFFGAAFADRVALAAQQAKYQAARLAAGLGND